MSQNDPKCLRKKCGDDGWNRERVKSKDLGVTKWDTGLTFETRKLEKITV